MKPIAVANRLIAVDPGVRRYALAIFNVDQKELEFAALLDVPQGAPFRVPLVPRAVLEMPRAYPGSRQKGDQNDLLELSRVVGRLEEAFRANGADVDLVHPRTWKGTVPKETMTERIRGRLSPVELSRVELPAPSLAHNVFDAIGIGLHALGRLEPRRVVAR